MGLLEEGSIDVISRRAASRQAVAAPGSGGSAHGRVFNAGSDDGPDRSSDCGSHRRSDCGSDCGSHGGPDRGPDGRSDGRCHGCAVLGGTV